MKLAKIFFIISCLTCLASCSKVLDKTDLSKLEPDLVFSDSALVQLNLSNLYETNAPLWGGQNTNSTLSGVQPHLSEESQTSGNKYMEGTVSYGTDEPRDFGIALNTSNPLPNQNWGKIRQVNTFIKSVEASPLPDYTKKKFIAQAKFFRAFRYWDLVRIYGGVPLVLSPLDGVGQAARDSALLPRNKTSECFAQIVADLDYAIANLPGKWTDPNLLWGSITKGAAAAFKGRVLLYYASPMFNPNDDVSRWQAAYDANLQAKQIIDANQGGLHSSYKNMWFQEINNPEAVMVTGYNTATGDNQKKNNGWDRSCRPQYLKGSGSNLPTWELVLSYPMKDGKKINDATGAHVYNDTFFYKNRDPRFDATIAYNGCTWPLDGNSTLKLWTYYDSATRSTEANASNTAFYCRKAVSEGAFTNNDPQFSGTDWMEIRYAEVLLNLAEAAVGIGKLGTGDEGYAGMIAVRKRAGITAGSNNLYGLASGMTRAQLFDAILFERKIEFAFEGKRFWDLYRWKRMGDLQGWYRNRLRLVLKKATGIPPADQLKNPSNPNYRDIQNLDTMMANYFQIIRNNNHDGSNSTTKLDANPINFKSTYYFWPIPMQAITNNPNLMQNNNWGGSFDPVQ